MVTDGNLTFCGDDSTMHTNIESLCPTLEMNICQLCLSNNNKRNNQQPYFNKGWLGSWGKCQTICKQTLNSEDFFPK